MAYKVINKFKDTDGVIYDVGESYPKDGNKPTKKRIEELSDIHPKYKKAFIEEAKEETVKKSEK